MKHEIKEKIEQINNGIIPDGYQKNNYIGIAPTSWQLGKMSDVVDNIQRPIPKPSDPYWRLGIKSWAKGTFQAFVDEPEKVNMDELYVVRNNDLIVNITFAWEHAIAIANKNDDGLLVSHRFPTYEFKEFAVPNYYKYMIMQKHFKYMLEMISPGGAGRNRVLNKKDFLSLPLYIPTHEEQEKIAVILETQDKIIELKEKIIEEKIKKKECVKRQLLTVEKRVKGFTGVWSKTELCNIYDYFQPTKYLVKNTLYNDEWQTPVLTAGKSFVLGYTNENFGIYNDYPVVIFDDFTTSSKYVDFPFKVKSSAIKILKCKEQYNDKFCFELLQAINFNVANHERHWISKYSIIPVLVPELEEQNAIMDILSQFNKEIDILKKTLDQEKQKKKALMQLLLTGIVRVR